MLHFVDSIFTLLTLNIGFIGHFYSYFKGRPPYNMPGFIYSKLGSCRIEGPRTFDITTKLSFQLLEDSPREYTQIQLPLIAKSKKVRF